jgi:hypothetical protein
MGIPVLAFDHRPRSFLRAGDGLCEAAWLVLRLGREGEEDEDVPETSVQNPVARSTGSRAQLAQPQATAPHGACVGVVQQRATLGEHPTRIQDGTELARVTASQLEQFGGELRVVEQAQRVAGGHARTMCERCACASAGDAPGARELDRATHRA